MFQLAFCVCNGKASVRGEKPSYKPDFLSARYSLVTLSPWVNDSVKHISFMYGAFSIVIFEQGWGIPTEDI